MLETNGWTVNYNQCVHVYYCPVHVAGSIPLSSRGVCIVQDIGSWKNNQKELLSKGVCKTLGPARIMTIFRQLHVHVYH